MTPPPRPRHRASPPRFQGRAPPSCTRAHGSAAPLQGAGRRPFRPTTEALLRTHPGEGLSSSSPPPPLPVPSPGLRPGPRSSIAGGADSQPPRPLWEADRGADSQPPCPLREADRGADSQLPSPIREAGAADCQPPSHTRKVSLPVSLLNRGRLPDGPRFSNDGGAVSSPPGAAPCRRAGGSQPVRRLRTRPFRPMRACGGGEAPRKAGVGLGPVAGRSCRVPACPAFEDGAVQADAGGRGRSPRG